MMMVILAEKFIDKWFKDIQEQWYDHLQKLWFDKAIFICLNIIFISSKDKIMKLYEKNLEFFFPKFVFLTCLVTIFNGVIKGLDNWEVLSFSIVFIGILSKFAQRSRKNIVEANNRISILEKQVLHLNNPVVKMKEFENKK